MKLSKTFFFFNIKCLNCCQFTFSLVCPALCLTGIQAWRRRWMFCQEQHRLFMRMKKRVSAVELTAWFLCVCRWMWTSEACSVINLGLISSHKENTRLVLCKLEVADTHRTPSPNTVSCHQHHFLSLVLVLTYRNRAGPLPPPCPFHWLFELFKFLLLLSFPFL